ncbi:hypothetical protein C8R43DRAFT_1159290, partial [Mycena crocata]
PTDAVRTALAAQKRPERQRGLLATNASYLVPDAIHKRFAAGLKTHVPLHYLTDAFCSHNNIASAKELDDLYALDGSRGVISVAKELPIAPELALSFEEWHQAWSRLLELFQTYLAQEYELWLAHYNRILHKPNKDGEWSIWVAYDSEIRRRSCTSALDPSLFHLDIWNEVEAGDTKRKLIETVRAEAVKAYGASAHGAKPKSNSFRANPNLLQLGGSGAATQFRCFVCADPDPQHRSRTCHAPRLVNGRDAIIVSRQQGAPRTDRQGNNYCYAWNGRTGCEAGRNCDHGKHWCSLCGAKDGSHSAQGCTRV